MPGVPPARYAYLGPAGTFAEAALRTIPAASRGELQPQSSVAAALDAVRRGEADHALVPIENSVEGSVSATLDELAVGDPLMVTREVLLPVSFALMVRPGTGLHDVRRVATHPHAARPVPPLAGDGAARRRRGAGAVDGRCRGRARRRDRRRTTPRSPRRSRPSTTGWRCWPPTSRTTRTP